MLRDVHRACYVYNDLKPQNIVVEDGQQEGESFRLHLVDFGFASKYAQVLEIADGNKSKARKRNLPEGERYKLCSNLHYASLNMLKFKTSSRRDDLQMLCYMLLAFFN